MPVAAATWSGLVARRSRWPSMMTVYCREAVFLSSGRHAVSFLSMPSDAAALGRVVRSQRERLHLSQAALAEQVGVSRSAISELEAGRISQPRATVFARLAKSLGLPAAALLAAAGYPEAEVLLEIETDEIAV